jgi:PBP1b-binding outer membrane lipoprotein LpoB
MWRNLTLAAVALTLAACAPMDEDDTIGSHLAQPPAGTPPQKPIDAGDIAIVGQEVSHGIMDLPAIANATVPPLVQFTGVTSIMDQPIDTEPYTDLLRDRLLLLTREKLRFVEHTLPPYIPPTKKKHKEASPQPVQNTDTPDYTILAELRGHVDSDFYKIQVQFVDARTSEVLFDGLYRIRKEADLEPVPGPVPQPPDGSQDTQPPPPTGDLTTPTTTEPPAAGGGTL